MDPESAAAAKAISLAQRIRAGDPAAEEELFGAYYRGVLLIATARTRDPEAARDLAQEVFVAVLKALREGCLREAEKLPAFIQGTARNLINNFLRSRVRRSECELDERDLESPDPVEDLESAERQRLVRREIDLCDPVDRQILVSSLIEGRSLAEIARQLNMSHEAVRARKSRLVKKITERFAGLSQKCGPQPPKH
jgi:RNA polymerase sigma-70 factor (ECF subfamily)